MLAMIVATLLIGAASAFACGYIYSLNAGYIIGAGLIAILLIYIVIAAFRRSKSNRMQFSGSVADELAKIDEMSGLEFEKYAADLLETEGYENVTVTQSSHDQGADILMERDGVRFSVQCKVYSTRLGNTPIQEITAAREFYDCHVGVVVTNSYFTDAAVELALANRILLWDRAYLASLIDRNM